jgi:ACS family hexuronate transporter-like MFS transporter
VSTSAPNRPVPPAAFFERNWRWFVLGTLFFATFLNYLDRQTLSNAADPICREFNLDNAQRGELLAKFVYYYAAAHLIVGPLVDRVRNFRWVFPVFVLGWSVCNLLVAFARDYTTLLWLRAALGVFEAGNFPICLLLIARIFPARERVLANGIFYSGGVIATLIAPKFVIYFATQHHWRWAFLITGGLGLVWLIPWLAIFRRPAERAPDWSVAANLAAGDSEGVATIFRRPAFWGVVLVGMGIIPGLYFMTQWLPSYLTQAWKVPYNQALGNRLVVISLCQDLGMWLGGGMVMALAGRGWTLLGARRLVIVIAYACMMGMLWLAHAPSINAAVAVLCLYVFGLGAWLANQQAFKQDVTRGRVATVVGLVGFAETMLSAILVERVGKITQQTGAYGTVFIALAVLFTFAVVMAMIFMRERWLPQQH